MNGPSRDTYIITDGKKGLMLNNKHEKNIIYLVVFSFERLVEVNISFFSFFYGSLPWLNNDPPQASGNEEQLV